MTETRIDRFFSSNNGSHIADAKAIFLLIAFYFASHVWIFFLGNSIFWDDWVIFPPTADVVIEKFRQVGAPFGWAGFLHLGLRFIGPVSYKLLTFLLYLASGILLYKIIKRQNGYWVEQRFFIIALFLIFPLNAARVAAINLPYALCYFLFFLAWWLIDRYRKLALLLFFLSFSTNSLLVFFSVPVLDLLIRRYGHPLKTGILFIRENYGLISLPFIFWALKLQFFKPYGLYEGYNAGFSFVNIPYSLGLQFKELIEEFWKLIAAFPNSLRIQLTLLFTFITYPVVRSAVNSSQKTSYKNALLTFLTGLSFVFIAEFPYLILGHPPRFYSWDSRHQLLMPLGVAVTFLGLSMLFIGKVRIIFASLILGFSIAVNFLSYSEYITDWAKHKEIMRLIADRNEIKHGRLIVFEDHTTIPNAKDRSVAYYEWNGMLTSLYGDERRFGVTQKEWSNDFCNPVDRRFNKHYMAADIPRDSKGDVVLVKIENTLNDDSVSVIHRMRNKLYPRLSVQIETGKNYCARLVEPLAGSKVVDE